MPIATTNENTVIPFFGFGDSFMVPTGKSIHYLILDMKEKAFVYLNVGVRRHSEKMAVFIAIDLIKIARQIIDGAHTYLPRAKNAVTHLRGDGQT